MLGGFNNYLACPPPLPFTQMALGADIAFIVLFMNFSVLPNIVKKGGNIESVAKKMRDMVKKVRTYPETYSNPRTDPNFQ